MVKPYSVTVSRQGGTTTISLTGAIDIAAGAEVRAVVTATTLRDRPLRLVLDLLGTTFIDATGANALVLARNAARLVGAELELRRPAPHLARVLELAGVIDDRALEPAG
ncbi:MAG: anti-sigma factor antagonist [Acidimicrobiaceae bacterium]|jgi:anti-anti-sigma factor